MDYLNDKSNVHTGCVCFKVINGYNIGKYVNTVQVGPILLLELLVFFARNPFKQSLQEEYIVIGIYSTVEGMLFYKYE